MSKKVRVNYLIPEDVKKFLGKYAKDNDTTCTSVVVKLIKRLKHEVEHVESV